MNIKKSDRLSKLPPYLFAEIDRKKAGLIKEGKDIISFGVGDPDIPTPVEIVEEMKKSVEIPAFHQYPFGRGLSAFREAVAEWYLNRFGVKLDPEKEVHALIGSKEGIGHLPIGLIDPGDVVLVPSPSYPVYGGGTTLAGGEVYYMPLKEENGFLPDIGSIPEKMRQMAKLMFINYPNNPTGAVADKSFYKRVIEFAAENEIVVASDNAYSEIFYEEKPMSFLEVEGAREVGVEFHSLSKTFNMTGWRIGFVVGNSEVVKIISDVKDNYDSGVFSAIQNTGIFALKNYEKFVEKNVKIWKRRRDVLCEGLRRCGFEVKVPKATFYVWMKVPDGFSSSEFCEKLLLKAAIVATPGSGFGSAGEGYVRFAFTISEERIEEAIERMRKIKN
ncbi:MAG: LL-diaminopimelate aminotransferase [Elusimicrobia bacterium]|nr:LL-diaminopimelate aminotransferase [Elusimicrobiota bacterium]